MDNPVYKVQVRAQMPNMKWIVKEIELPFVPYPGLFLMGIGPVVTRIDRVDWEVYGGFFAVFLPHVSEHEGRTMVEDKGWRFAS